MTKKLSVDKTKFHKPNILIYRTEDGIARLEVRFQGDTVWLSLNEMAALFQRDKSVISRHLASVYREGELRRDATVAKNATVQVEGKRRIIRSVEYYNLDAIISVGYRVNSKRGTQFRIWATKVLHDHLIQGYSVNAKRLKALQKTLKVAADISKQRQLSGEEASALVQTISDYAYALDLIDDYDHQRVNLQRLARRRAKPIAYDEAKCVIETMRKKFNTSNLFGREKDQSLNSSLAAVMQSFDSQDLYPSLEEKAAHLLYFLVKNHSFVDGNKRIAAALFLCFLEKNRMLHHSDGTRRIADNALVAMTLMIAESRPAEKNVIASMVANLINGKN